MSVQHLHNIPCPVCQRDTMHLVMRCRECGNVQQSPSAQRATSRKRFFARNGRGQAEILAGLIRSEVSAGRRAEYAATPDASAPISKGLKFGRERSRV